MQSLFSIQTIKLLFVAASSLYSLAFLNRHRKQKKQQKIIQERKELIMKQLKSMKYDDNNCEKLQRLFTIIEEVGAEQMDQKLPSTSNPGKNNDSKSNARSEQIPKKQQLVSEVDKIMIDILLEQLTHVKTCKQLAHQWHQENQRGNLYLPHNFDQLGQGQSGKQLNIKPSSRNVRAVEDAIIQAVPAPSRGSQDNNFQFIPPHVEDRSMHDNEISLLERIQQKKKMLTNQEYLKQNRIVLELVPIKDTNTDTSTNSINRENLTKKKRPREQYSYSKSRSKSKDMKDFKINRTKIAKQRASNLSQQKSSHIKTFKKELLRKRYVQPPAQQSQKSSRRQQPTKIDEQIPDILSSDIMKNENLNKEKIRRVIQKTQTIIQYLDQ